MVPPLAGFSAPEKIFRLIPLTAGLRFFTCPAIAFLAPADQPSPCPRTRSEVLKRLPAIVGSDEGIQRGVYLGARIMIIMRPSFLADCSTTANSDVSSITR